MSIGRVMNNMRMKRGNAKFDRDIDMVVAPPSDIAKMMVEATKLPLHKIILVSSIVT